MQLVIFSRCSRVVRCIPKIVTICKLFVYSNIESRRKFQLSTMWFGIVEKCKRIWIILCETYTKKKKKSPVHILYIHIEILYKLCFHTYIYTHIRICTPMFLYVCKHIHIYIYGYVRIYITADRNKISVCCKNYSCVDESYIYLIYYYL